MPIPFSEISVLLSRLEDLEYHHPPFLRAADKAIEVKSVTESWFRSHRRAIDELEIEDAVALLSALLPERRTDRVYGIQTVRLCRILSRSLGLSAARARDLEGYKQPGRGDLGACLERVLTSGGPPAHPPVHLGEVEDMLTVLAGHSRFSDPNIPKLPPSSSEVRDTLIGNIFKRLQPGEGKWLVRVILKDLSPIRVNEALVLRCFHFLLPDILRFQDNFRAAIALLMGPLRDYPAQPDPRSQRLHRRGAAALLKPQVGIKVSRPQFHKARSIDHCIDMLGGQKWILERKYDGEYCEIHIDMSHRPDVSKCIKIFSKSGKDSTEDRQGIHETLIECLRLGKPECKIKRRAILLGELVVYSDKERRIQPFEKIRKYVTRSGVSLGTDLDSQPCPHEHLAIVFFDLLLLDDEVVMAKPLEERRMWLRETYTKIAGQAMSSEWKIVDFSNDDHAKKALVQQFAASIAERCEGLILKPTGVPYFSLESGGDGYTKACIKVKKDYIAGMGDEADFAVVGASYHGQQALKSDTTNIKWTESHLGCLTNKTDALRFDARPKFKIVGTIRAEMCIPKPVLQAASLKGSFSATPYPPKTAAFKFDLIHGTVPKMDVTFKDPLVFEVLGSGFEKPSNADFFMLRHARVKKLHQDRSWKDCVSFQELQEQAVASRAAPADSESQETKRWISRLEAKCRKKVERERMSTPGSRKTETPVSSRSAATLATKAAAMTVSTPAGAVTSSALDGTTLVGTTSSSQHKRQRDNVGDTPCPALKRRHVEQAPQPTVEVAAVRASKSNIVREPAPLPLADITNSAPRPPPDSAGPRRKKSPASLRSLHRANISLVLPSQASSTEHDDRAQRCISSPCLFDNAVVYLTPCIATTAYIRKDLLAAHNLVLISNLAHWSRDSFAHPSMADTVSESQAYSGLRKIVLVESKRAQATRHAVKAVQALNDGSMRERIEVYDWRVLESCRDHDLAAGSGKAKRYLVGATMFDEGRQRALFVENARWYDVGV